MQFDARAAKLLKPGEHIMVEGSPGLRLKATATRRTWTYRYKSPVDGRMRQIAIGAWPAMSLASAVVAWEALRQRRDDGEDPAVERRGAKAAAVLPTTASRRDTVRQVVDEYLEGHIDSHRKPKGAAEVRRMFDGNLGDFGKLKASALTRSQAFAFLESIAKTPVQAAYLRQELGAAWDYALDAGRLPESAPNWWRLIMRGRLRSKGRKLLGESIGTAKRVLSPAEVGELIRWLPNFTQLGEDALTLMLWTGARGGEVTAMHADEIREEVDGLWWTVPKNKTKNARHENATDLRVPLVGRARAVVLRRLQAYPGGYVFPSRGRYGYVEQKTIGVAVHWRMPYSNTQPQYQRARLPVTRWAPHDLRRTARTLLAAMGCPQEVAEAVLGHMPSGIVGVYNLHRYDAERRDWLTRLAERLEQMAQQP
ncbi:integrase family protein [Xylophilus sp. Leaf220]|uniref:tyrosine-type recombinase/integrase n=1 Tax=Xylophilus sp. Leaf220 TaxID=1735686 RepID=UPI0006FF1A76|nr:integrase family protein [Xylophilus sp. Leaf220]KQM68802.1 alpha/beta hydrolase [Xylophilus sp. Leaf220]